MASLAGYFGYVTANIMDVAAYALVDYVYSNFIYTMLAPAGRIGTALGGGLDFAMKAAVSVTHPLSGVIRMG